MRYVFNMIVLIFLSVFTNCHSQEEQSNFDEITYEARTRGSFFSIKVSKTKVLFENTKGIKEYPVSKVKRGKLTALLNKIKLNELHGLKAPSDGRASDRSMHATLKVTKGTKQYTSSTFDAENPPKELKELLKTIYSLQKLE